MPNSFDESHCLPRSPLWIWQVTAISSSLYSCINDLKPGIGLRYLSVTIISFFLLFRTSNPLIVATVVQSLSRVWLFGTPWTIAHQASLSFTISQSFLKLMSFESVMPSNHLILCHSPLLLPSIFAASGSFLMSGSSHQVAKVLELQLQHQSFQWIFRIDFL